MRISFSIEQSENQWRWALLLNGQEVMCDYFTSVEDALDRCDMARRDF